MKAALIPPIAHLEEFCTGARIHLVLAHLLGDVNYLSFYRRERLKGGLIILDNGAHENTSGMNMRDLLMRAESIRADEVVLPDTLFDHRATVRGAEDALDYLLGPGQDDWGPRSYPGFMVVPQGKSMSEWERAFRDLIAAYVKAQVARTDLFPRTITIGISKDYEAWQPGGIRALVEYLAPFREWITFEVHLLGWGRNLWALRDIARDFPWVRSTDSAKPFVYAMHGDRIALDDFPRYPGRLPDYFHQTMGTGTSRIAWRNVEVFREAAHDTSG